LPGRVSIGLRIMDKLFDFMNIFLDFWVEFTTNPGCSLNSILCLLLLKSKPFKFNTVLLF